MLKPRGMCDAAFHSYIQACYSANVNPTKLIIKTLDNSKDGPSADTHCTDGVEDGQDYTVAIDLALGILSDNGRKQLMHALYRNGFFGWYRHTGSFAEHVHGHFVYSGKKMKKSLQRQYRDWANGLNGLVSHAPDDYCLPTDSEKQVVMNMYSRANG